MSKSPYRGRGGCLPTWVAHLVILWYRRPILMLILTTIVVAAILIAIDKV